MNTNTMTIPGQSEVATGNSSAPLFAGKKLLARIVFLTVFAFLFVTAGNWITDPETLPIRNVRVEGEFRQLSPEVLQTIVTGVVRDGFFNVNVELIKSTLSENPWISQVTVHRVWPDGLNVQIVEQLAVARWGKQALISPDAELFAPPIDTFPEGLPQFNGPENTSSLILNRYIQIRDALGKQELTVTGLNLGKRWSWSFSLQQGTTILLGRRDVSSRIHRFSDLMTTDLGARLNEIKVVDMRYTNGFALQWKEQGAIDVESGRENHG
jgi:cell division protein FtsQ